MNDIKTLLALIPLLPLIGFAINGLGYRIIPKAVSGVIGTLVVLASFCIALSIFLGQFMGETSPVAY